MLSLPTKTETTPLGEVIEKTKEALVASCLGTYLIPISRTLNHRSNGRTELKALAWGIGDEQPLAECRMVHIRGVSSEIVNVVIFPTNPEQLPLFAADLLITGGQPRMAFLDLPVVSSDSQLRERIAQETCLIADEHKSLRSDTPPESWAITYSPGGYYFSRPKEEYCVSRWKVVLDAYLAVWIRYATNATYTIPGITALEGLRRFKRERVEHSPNWLYLSRVFGEEWADRFINEFLYA